ncbi:MAG: heme ABC transporter substrate-binding protein IsdE [Solibacillus sp.]
MKQSKSYIYVIGFLLMILMLVGCGKTEETAPVSADEVMEADEASSELRLVTTTAAVTKIFEELDLDLVGVPTTIQTLAARYDDAVRVGNPMGPDVEIIASLKPTEVFSVTTLEYDLKESFESLNIPATYVNLQGLQQMKDSILDIGNRYDRAARAQEIVDTMDKEIAELQRSVEGKEKPKVLILLGIPGSYLVATENSYIGDLVRLAGGENIAAGQAAEYLPSNTEFLHQSNPDIIIRLAHGMPEEVVKMFQEEFKTNDIWKHFNAVQNDRVYDLEEPLFGTTATMEVTTALTQLIDTMYGEQ